jgi:hypothetical protein
MLAVASLVASHAGAEGYAPGPPPDNAPFKDAGWKGAPGWLVLGEASKSERDIAQIAAQRWAQGIVASPLRTDLFRNLRKGLTVLVYGAAPDRKGAEALVERLQAKGVETYAKASGPCARSETGAAQRLVRVWGHLYDDIRFPARVDIDGTTAYTDTRGWYQAWVPVDAGATGELELSVDLSQPVSRKGCNGWFDKVATVPYGPVDKEIYVNWSPSPDCGE